MENLMYTIRLNLIFLIAIICSNPYALQSMEKWSLDKPNNSATKEPNSSKPKKKRNRGKKKQGTLRTQPQRTFVPATILNLPTHCPAQELAKRHSTLDLPALLGDTHKPITSRQDKESYLGKLHLMRNMLIVMEEYSKHLEDVAHHDSEALATEHPLHSIQGFFYGDKQKRIDDNNDGCIVLNESQQKAVFPTAYFLNSAEAKAAAMQAKNIIRWYNTSKELKNNLSSEHKALEQFSSTLDASDNEELTIISQWMKNHIHQGNRSLNLAKIVPLMDIIVFMNAKIPFDQMNLVTTDKDFVYNLRNIVANGRTRSVVEDWLGALNPLVQTHMPHALDIFDITEFAIREGHVIDQQLEYMDYQQNLTFNTKLKNLLTSLQANKQNYQYLHDRLVAEQNRFFTDKKCGYRRDLLKKYSTTVLLTDKNMAALPSSVFAQKSQQQHTDPLFLAQAFVKSQKKVEQLRASKKQIKKAMRLMGQQEKFEKEEFLVHETSVPMLHHTLAQNTYQTTTPDLGQYDDRCLRWFDKDFLQKNSFSREQIEKHTFAFACDHYIFKYGIPQDWPNRTNEGQIDTCYYMGGEIIHLDGQKQTVLFACCKDPKGICYHRGIQSKESTLFAEFETAKFEYDYPAYYHELEPEKKLVTSTINNSLYSKTCYENQFYISIFDEKNKVTYILFKPNFQNN